jgi:hypothetical protein
MNSTFRLRNILPPSGQKDRPQLLIGVYAVLFVTLSCSTAFIHSFFAVDGVDFGCQALAWTLIFVVCSFSFMVDSLLLSSIGNRLGVTSCQNLWRWVVLKDLAVSLYVASAMVTVHINVMSTCRCMIGSIIPPLKKHTISLLATSANVKSAQWVQITLSACVGFVLMFVCFIFLAGYYGSWSRTILCPIEEEAYKIQFRLQKLREIHEALVLAEEYA